MNQMDWDSGNDHAHTNAAVIVHRLLRGKYVLTITLALVLGILGAAFGYSMRSPEYESIGQIRIQPSLPKVLFTSEQNTVTQMFSSFVNTQAELIQNNGVIQRALESDEWRAVSHLSKVESAFDVRKVLKVRTNRNAQQIIGVSYTDTNAMVSKTMVEVIMDSYLEQFSREGSIDIPEVVGMLTTRQTTLIADRNNYDAQILAIAGRYRTENLQPLVENAIENLSKIEAQRDFLSDQLARYEQIADGSTPSAQQLTPEEAAVDDPMIADLIARSKELKDAKDDMMIAEGLREGHRDVQRLTSMIENNTAQIDARLEELLGGEKTLVYIDANGDQIPSELMLRTRIERLDADITRSKTDSKKLFEDSVQLKDYRDKRANKQESIIEVTQRLDQIDTESSIEDMQQITGKISITSRPMVAREPTSDPRLKMAAAGFVGMGSLPVMIILAIGFFSDQVHYSDDSALMGEERGIIGMLPDLGDSLADKELASASAFAVHQIRSQLQIKNQLNEPRVYGVTSPAPRDGKTSMIIAIGLSFAESGDRTLLVDMDFVGRGLSIHFGHPNAPSLAEALGAREEIDELIQETEFEGLSMLPAGFGDDERVSRLSPKSVGAFIAHLRTSYDTVLVDTGPILGSVEAAFVTPQSDGIIMVIGRGQYKPLIKKAVDQVFAVGGEIVATIFNRALSRELRQSSNSMSVHFSRQMSRQQAIIDSKPDMRVGPVASALFRSKNRQNESANSEDAES